MNEPKRHIPLQRVGLWLAVYECPSCGRDTVNPEQCSLCQRAEAEDEEAKYRKEHPAETEDDLYNEFPF